MSRYSDQTVTLVADVNVPVQGVDIYVYTRAGELAALTEDGGGDLANPVTSDQYGNFHFTTDDGLYDLSFHYGGKEIDKWNGVQVGAGPALPAEILAALISPSTPSIIGYAPGSATTETLEDWLDRQPIFVESYRYNGVTVRSDTDTLLAAFAAWTARGGGACHLDPNRVYDLGTIAVETLALPIHGIRGGTLEGNGATLQVHVPANYVDVVYVYDCQALVIRNLSGVDPAPALGLAGTIGGKLIVLDANLTQGSDGITIDNCHATGFNTHLNIQGNPPNKRITNVYINPNCSATNCFYGITFQNNGDFVTGGLYAINCGRAYFSYGVTSHNIAVRRSDDGTGIPVSAGELIKRYIRNTTNILLDVSWASGSDLSAMGSIVTIEHENDDGAASIIDDIDIAYHVPDEVVTNAIPRLKLQSRAFDGTAQTTSDHYTGRVSVGGHLAEISVAHIQSNYVPSTPGVITLRSNFSGFSRSKTVDAPGWLIKVAPDRYVIEKFGDLTSGVLTIPVSALALYRGMFRVTVYAEPKKDNSDGLTSKMHMFEDLVCFFVNDGPPSCNILTGTPISLQARAVNSSTLARTIAAAAGAKINYTFGSDTDYAVSTAYVRAEIECISRPLTRR